MSQIKFVSFFLFVVVVKFARRCLQFTLDGWMNCDFTSFLTVLQSYQDDGRLIMKGCVQWNSVYG